MTKALLLDHSPSAPQWMSVFGSLMVPLASAQVFHKMVRGEEQRFFFLDVGSLNQEQMGRLVGNLAARFRKPIMEVYHCVIEYGVPIPVEDVLLITTERSRNENHCFGV